MLRRTAWWHFIHQVYQIKSRIRIHCFNHCSLVWTSCWEVFPVFASFLYWNLCQQPLTRIPIVEGCWLTTSCTGILFSMMLSIPVQEMLTRGCWQRLPRGILFGIPVGGVLFSIPVRGIPFSIPVRGILFGIPVRGILFSIPVRGILLAPPLRVSFSASPLEVSFSASPLGVFFSASLLGVSF